MDSNVHGTMRKIRDEADEHLRQQDFAQQKATAASRAVEGAVDPFLQRSADEYIAGDPDRLTLSARSHLTFSLQYDPRVSYSYAPAPYPTETSDASSRPVAKGAWEAPLFTVSANAFPNGAVTVSVKDGSWDYNSKALGNWANWEDDDRIYQGVWDPAAVQKALNQAFLAWYRRTANAQ